MQCPRLWGIGDRFFQSGVESFSSQQTQANLVRESFLGLACGIIMNGLWRMGPTPILSLALSCWGVTYLIICESAIKKGQLSCCSLVGPISYTHILMFEEFWTKHLLVIIICMLMRLPITHIYDNVDIISKSRPFGSLNFIDGFVKIFQFKYTYGTHYVKP